MPSFALFVALVVMLIGAIGTLFPALPGLPLIWLAMLGYGFVEQFQEMTAGFLGTTFLVVILSMVAEHYARIWGAKRFGAKRAGAWGAVIGSIAGLFFMPIGLLVGPFFGALVFELLSGRSLEEAVSAGWGGLVGALSSVLMNLVLALTLMVAFILKVLF